MGKTVSKVEKSVNKKNNNIKPCAEHLKSLRKSKGLSQEELAFQLAEVGGGDYTINKSYISNWERGGGIRKSNLEKYMILFGCTLDYLMGFSNVPNMTERQQKQLNRITDREDLNDYMKKHRAALVEYAAELCDGSVRFDKDMKRYIIEAEVHADFIQGNAEWSKSHDHDISQEWQYLEWDCTESEFDMITRQVDRAVENIFKSYIETKYQAVTVEELPPAIDQ